VRENIHWQVVKLTGFLVKQLTSITFSVQCIAYFLTVMLLTNYILLT